MIKLVVIGVAILAFPLVSWWAESRDPDKNRIIRMADRDRAVQAVQPMTRRMQYARYYKPKLKKI
jgi:hypothetical protein